MRYRLILPIAVLLAALVAVPAAQAKVRVGLSEQNPAMFAESNWTQLKLKRVRYILPWDYAKHAGNHAEVTSFMNAARAKRQEVLVTFGARRGCFNNNRYSKKKACKAPSQKAYKAAVKAFRKEFPGNKTFTPWNEVNHVSQPTYRKPKLAAKLLQVAQERLQGLHGHGRRRARLERREDAICAGSCARPRARAASGACTTTRTSTAARARA